MPQLIRHIDQIARKKQRDVLYLRFGFVPKPPNYKPDMEYFECQPYLSLEDELRIVREYNECTNRQIILDWLTENNIEYEKCAHIASESGWMSYSGDIYVDVPFDLSNETYQKLSEYLGDEDCGWCKNFHAVRFMWLPLELAMRNAHHDEPGFWEKWAETF